MTSSNTLARCRAAGIAAIVTLLGACGAPPRGPVTAPTPIEVPGARLSLKAMPDEIAGLLVGPSSSGEGPAYRVLARAVDARAVAAVVEPWRARTPEDPRPTRAEVPVVPPGVSAERVRTVRGAREIRVGSASGPAMVVAALPGSGASAEGSVTIAAIGERYDVAWLDGRAAPATVSRATFDPRSRAWSDLREAVIPAPPALPGGGELPIARGVLHPAGSHLLLSVRAGDAPTLLALPVRATDAQPGAWRQIDNVEDSFDDDGVLFVSRESPASVKAVLQRFKDGAWVTAPAEVPPSPARWPVGGGLVLQSKRDASTPTSDRTAAAYLDMTTLTVRSLPGADVPATSDGRAVGTWFGRDGELAQIAKDGAGRLLARVYTRDGGAPITMPLPGTIEPIFRGWAPRRVFQTSEEACLLYGSILGHAVHGGLCFDRPRRAWRSVAAYESFYLDAAETSCEEPRQRAGDSVFLACDHEAPGHIGSDCALMYPPTSSRSAWLISGVRAAGPVAGLAP